MGTLRNVAGDRDEYRRRLVTEQLKPDLDLVGGTVAAVMESLVTDLIHGTVLKRPH